MGKCFRSSNLMFFLIQWEKRVIPVHYSTCDHNIRNIINVYYGNGHELNVVNDMPYLYLSHV